MCLFVSVVCHVAGQVLESEASSAGTATFVGTPHYLAPELFSGDMYDERADAWALGCVLYEMLCFCRPFHQSEKNIALMSLRISQGSYDEDLLEEQLAHYPLELLDATRGLLQLERAKRLRAAEVVAEVAELGSSVDTRSLPTCWDALQTQRRPSVASCEGTQAENPGTDSWRHAEVQSSSTLAAVPVRTR